MVGVMAMLVDVEWPLVESKPRGASGSIGLALGAGGGIGVGGVGVGDGDGRAGPVAGTLWLRSCCRCSWARWESRIICC